jgi:hypothetical protein
MRASAACRVSGLRRSVRSLPDRACGKYWIVDGDEQVVEQLVLEGQEYGLPGRLAGEVISRGLPGVPVDLTRVW